jgi:RimJ/RimL family protein N-acetyltransferase/ketosteroid isomerase-like protein
VTDPRAFAPDLRLSGHGLVLREWTDEDLTAMTELFDDPDIAYRTPLASPFDAQAALDYLARARREREQGLRVRLAITEDGITPRGEVLLIRQHPDDAGASLGYTVGAAQRGRGLASRALRLMTDYARSLGMWPLTLSIEEGNRASEAVARAGGYRLSDAAPMPTVNKDREVTLRTWVYGPDARPGAADEEHAAVWATVAGVYEAHRGGSRAAVDASMHPDATMWDSDAPQLLHGRADLDRVRDTRPATSAEQAETVLTPYGQVIDVFGDLALARYWLRVELPSRGVQLVRNTAVLARTCGGETDRWLFIHLHEDAHGSPTS